MKKLLITTLLTGTLSPGFAADKSSQTISAISFTPTTLTVGDMATAQATATSGLPVRFTSTTPDICRTRGNYGRTVFARTAGSCIVAANQAGNARYSAAPQVTQNLAINQTQQTISAIRITPSTLLVGGTATAQATATSGMFVKFSSTTPAICTIKGSTVTALAAGTCIVAANQAGNTRYSAAPQVTKNLVITQKNNPPPNGGGKPPPPNGGGNPPPPNDGGNPPNGGGGTTSNGSGMDIADTISDEAQSMTIAFDGLAFVTGTACAQTFYPPGKVADFFGFQYLRDNDPSGMGHNTDFTTLTANPILVLLKDAQLKTLQDLGTAEAALNDSYGYARFPLIQAFRRLNDNDLPTGKTDLSLDAVKAYSAYLFGIDGEMSAMRARAYASVLGSMDATQQAALAAMKGKGSLAWTQPSQSEVDAVLAKYPGQMMRTYAGEMLAWYLGNSDADTYFCPEREGTYFGSFFMKDIKAMHNPSYTIDSNMTANMGNSFLAALDTTQKAKITGLVDEQKTDLLAIVAKRNTISTTLRNLLGTKGTVDDASIINLAKQYGELDGEISYYYAKNFSAVGTSLTDSQKATLMALRKTATAESGGSPDYDASCGNGYLYSAPLQSPPTVINTDFLFGACSSENNTCSTDWECCSFSCSSHVCTAPFTFTSSAFSDGATLPSIYGGNHDNLSPPLSWGGAPTGTKEFALLMTTVALDGTKYNWVHFHIPATVTALAQGNPGAGQFGKSSDGDLLQYYGPNSSGPGEKIYTFTLYALSGVPTFSVAESAVTGPILLNAIQSLILESRQINVRYTTY